MSEKKFKRISKPFFVGVILFTFFLGYLIKDIKFDYDFEKFFPKSDEEAKYYFEHREVFQSDNDFLLIAIERSNGIFNKNFLHKVERLRAGIAKLQYVEFARSISNEDELFLVTGGAVGRKPFISNKNALSEDSARVYKHKELLNTLIAKDGKSLCIYVKHQDFLPGKKSEVLIDEIQKEVAKYPFEKVRIGGRTIGQKFYIGKMKFEMLFFVSLSLVLVIIFLWIAFKSLWGVLLPQLVIAFSTIWILGLMVIIDEPINIILSILPSIMFVVAMSDVIHLVSRYLDALRTGVGKYEAIKISLYEVGLATLLTSLTTAVGFATLMFINVEPIQSFGKVTAFGVLIAFIVTIFLLPVSFYIFPSPKKILVEKEAPFWNKFLSNWFILIMKNRKKVLLFSGIILLFFTIASLFLNANNYLMDDLKSSEPIKQDFNFLDQHYGGVRPVELIVRIKDQEKNCWDLGVLEEVDKVEKYLETSYGAKMNASLVGFIKVLNQASHNANPDKFELPSTKRMLSKLRRPLRMAAGGKLFSAVCDSTLKNLRISASIPDIGNDAVTLRNKKLFNFIKKNIDSSVIDIQLTGTAHLLDKNMNYLSMSLLQGILLSIAVIVLIMGLVFKSIKIVLISIIPNIIPLLVLSGLMALTGIEIKITTAIIFTISFGIAVDDTIHFLGKFRLELSKGKSMLYALKRTYLTTGKAMILTTLILCSGFMMLLFSSFMGTFIMGLMISVTLFVALIADLFLLPVLLLLFYKPKMKK